MTRAAGEPAPAGATRRGDSIHDFLTDGALAKLCESLSALAECPIELHDELGRHIVPNETDLSRPWRVVEDTPEPGPGDQAIPIVAGDRVVGRLVRRNTPDAPAAAGAAVGYLAMVVSELLEQETALRERVEEVELMHRLGSMLVRTGEADDVLRESLRSAIEVLGLDAGSVVLFTEQEEDSVGGDLEDNLVLKASQGLSEEWLYSPIPLSRGRLFDRLVLSGEVVEVPDLTADPRVLQPERARREGLVGFLSAGLVFRGRPIGAFRLYARSRRTFTEQERRLLRSVAEHSAVAVEQARLLALREEERRMQRQLALAADVQRRMMPSALPEAPGFEFAARYIPSEVVGGDFYDIVRHAGRIELLIGDVVGHGIAAALMMASVRGSLRAFADSGRRTVPEIVGRVNRAMCRDTQQSEFATLWYAHIDADRRVLHYCSAGHEPPVLLSSDGTVRSMLDAGGMVVGVEPGHFYDAAEVELLPGDVLVAFTDGLSERQNFQRRAFGRARLIEAVQRAVRSEPAPTAPEIIEHVFWSIRQFAGLQSTRDDETLLVVRVGEG